LTGLREKSDDVEYASNNLLIEILSQYYFMNYKALSLSYFIETWSLVISFIKHMVGAECWYHSTVIKRSKTYFLFLLTMETL